MKTKPILFSTEMVQAILDGRKTQTRRVIKPQPSLINDNVHFNWNGDYYLTREQMLEKAPILQGTILWVRETSAITTNVNHKDDPEWPDRPHKVIDVEDGILLSARIYRADGPWNWVDDDGFDSEKSHWKPSIFMPKAACRIFLKVTNVRVERLQDISEPDAVAEGVRYWADEDDTDLLDAIFKNYETGERNLVSSFSSFRSLWLSINGEKSWDADPWVWVYDFKKVERPENFLS